MESYGAISDEELRDKLNKCRDYIQFFFADNRWMMHCGVLGDLLNEFEEIQQFCQLRELK